MNILSLYLGFADKKTASKAQFETQFHELIHSLSEKDRLMFREDIAAVEKYIQDILDTRNTRGIVFFSSGKNFWKVLSFEFYLAPFIGAFDKPYATPLFDALNEHDRYLVILADRKRAIIFTMHLGKIEEHEEIANGAVPQRVKHGENAWDAQDKIFRHIEDHLNRHLKIIAAKAEDFAKTKGIHFVILGGHKTIFSKLKNHLPLDLQKKVIGTFVSALNIPLSEIALHSKRVSEDFQQNSILKKLEERLK